VKLKDKIEVKEFTHPDSFGITPLDIGENLIGSKY